MFEKLVRSLACYAIVAGLGAIAIAQAPPGGQGQTQGQDRPAAPAKKKAFLQEKAEFAKKKAALQALDGVKIERDVTYATVGKDHDRALKLDLYLPEKAAAGNRPLVVWIHGGGWRKGSKAGTQAARLATFGYVVASIEYRLTDEAIFPAQIEDCKAAIRWLRANAEKYHIDPQRVGVWGSSAGGHLVALLGTAGDESKWDVGAHTDQSSRVQAVCDYFGPADLADMPAAQAARADGPVALLLGGPVAEKTDAAKAASPVTYISKDDPPFLICHGTEDALVPISQSENFLTALKAAGIDATLLKVKGAGHGFSGEAPDPPIREIQDRVRAFFDAKLKNGKEAAR